MARFSKNFQKYDLKKYCITKRVKDTCNMSDPYSLSERYGQKSVDNIDIAVFLPEKISPTSK